MEKFVRSRTGLYRIQHHVTIISNSPSARWFCYFNVKKLNKFSDVCVYGFGGLLVFLLVAVVLFSLVSHCALEIVENYKTFRFSTSVK